MRSEIAFFQLSAAAALVLLFRHAWRTFGRRDAILLFGFLLLMGTVRELDVVAISQMTDKPHPFSPDAAMAKLGPVSMGVVGGWVFCAYTSFFLARLIQRRSLRGTNVFMTLALSALITMGISYAVEVTGMRLHLWDWEQHASYVGWLPFGWTFNAFDGWAATSFNIMLLWCTLRYKLFSPVRWLSALVGTSLFVLFAGADFVQKGWSGTAPHMFLSIPYLLGAIALGYRAPAWMLGSSSNHLGFEQTRARSC
ncbi:MAG: hypothetical protein HY898_32100 [Deltaproteobacteria bacterium]|nr:hypothetical protein [Deltaproteobacteria bacterium]